MRHRWVGGVASGIARFIGLDVWPIRMLIRFCFVAFTPMLWWIYLILWIVLPAQKLYDSDAPRYRVRSRSADPVDEELENLKRELRRGSSATQPRQSPAARPSQRKSIYKPQMKVEIKRLEFDDVVEMTRGKVSEQIFEKVEVIDRSTRALMPHLNWWRTLTQNDLATVKRAALEFFPQAITHYLSLPRDYAENHRLATGQTPEEKLLADLSILENTLNKVLESVYNNDKLQVPSDLKNLNERFVTPENHNEDINRNLEVLLRRIQGKVPDDIYRLVTSIRTSILAVLPQITEMGGGITQDSFNVRQTALEYLPDALEKYMNLPQGFAERHTLSNGKTAKGTLMEQLEILDKTMKDIIGDVYQDDADALLIHGRFLKEKFADQKFDLPDSHAEQLRFPDLEVKEESKIKLN